MKVSLSKGEKRTSYSSASLFNGFLMSILQEDLVLKFHEQGYNAYSQFISWDEESLYWNIHSVGEEVSHAIEKTLGKVKEIKIRENDQIHKVMAVDIQKMDREKLLQDTYFSESSFSHIRIRFLSPTAFKSKGEYQFYPSLFHILQSVMLKHDSVEGQVSLFDQDVFDDLLKHTRVVGYNLRSYQYYLKGGKIPSFIGNIDLQIFGPKQMKNLMIYILKYAEFTGVGIKSSLGMGAVEISLK